MAKKAKLVKAIKSRVLVVDEPCPVSKEVMTSAADNMMKAARIGDSQGFAAAKKSLGMLSLVRDRWLARQSFEAFVNMVAPDVIMGRHHRKIAEAFDGVVRGKIKRLQLAMPPGHTKSLFGSILLPAWLFGLNPQGRILHTSHTKGLVEDFSRHVKQLIDSDEYRRLFPDCQLDPRRAAVEKWSTTLGGIYNAVGVGGAVAGKRADLAGIIDDPISEQDAYSETVRERVKTWYPGGFRSRMLPGTPIIMIMTRWHTDDLAGAQQKLAKANRKQDQWKVISFPAILDEKAAEMLGGGAKAGEALFPEIYDLDELLSIKAELPPYQWSALYQQSPTNEGNGIFPANKWQPWPKGREIPPFDFVLQVWDTAYEENEKADYTACTTWGVFEDWSRPNSYNVMILGRFEERVEFPKLRASVVQYYKDFKADIVLVEPKASGKSIVQELKRTGIPIREWSNERNSRGKEKSKHQRAHSSSTVLWSEQIYYPEWCRWAEEVIEQCEEFPNGAHDDLVDTCTMAWAYLRKTGWIKTRDDWDAFEPIDRSSNDAGTEFEGYGNA